MANSWCEIDAIQITGSYLASSSPATDGEIDHSYTSPTATDGEIYHSYTSPAATDGKMESYPTTSTVGDIDHSSSSTPLATAEIDQWVSNVIGFSSQYNDNGWDIGH